MRRLIALAMLIATTLSSSAETHFEGRRFQPCDNRPPDSAQQPVDVPVTVKMVPGSEMFTECRKSKINIIIYGCTFLPTAGHPALIFLNADQYEMERACTLIYEEAHLPPNNWLDVSMEAATPNARP